MFSFIGGTNCSEDDGSDKENSVQPPPSSPPWLKKRRLTPLNSPVDSEDESDLEFRQTDGSVAISVDNNHIRAIKSIRYCKNDRC